MKESEIREQLIERGVEFKDDATAEELLATLNEVLADEGEEEAELDETEPEEEEETKPPKSQAKASAKAPAKPAAKPVAKPAPKNPMGTKIDPPVRVPDVTPEFQPPKRGGIMPGDRGGEYQSIPHVEGKTVKITMESNVRHDGERFLQGKTYVVSNGTAKQFKTEGWAA